MKRKLLTAILVATMIGTLALTALPKQGHAKSTVVTFIPEVTELGDPVAMPDVVGTHFFVALVVEDVADLYGFDLQVSWPTEWVRYVGHTTTVPVEDYPDPQPPSPYPGILHEPYFQIKDEVNETGIPGAAPGALAWFSYSSLDPAEPFNGNGTVVVFEFEVVNQPWSYQDPVNITFHIVSSTLSDTVPSPIPHTPIDVNVTLWQRLYVPPPKPKLKVMPESVEGQGISNTFNIDVMIMGEDGGDLDPWWDVAGFDIVLNFDPSLIEATSVTIDPDGWFAAFWPDGIFIVLQEINNTAGTVHVVFLGLPGEGGEHTAPYGIGRLFSVTFHEIYESETYPPPSCSLALYPTEIAGFPHPEREMPPWEGRETSVPIDHVVEDGMYTAKFLPPGAWIDIYTQYPDPYGGQGPNQPSDAFGPQMEVVVYAYVTYNLWPVQNKLVTFEIMHGEYDFLRQAWTDENGIAKITFRIPWPCDDPEGRVFGEWTIIATVDVYENVVNDTLTFQVNYLIDIVSIESAKDAYVIGDHMSFNVTYRSISHQLRNATITLVVYDDVGVPIAYAYVPLTNIEYGEHTITIECMVVPKWTAVGTGTVYVNILTDLPKNGGAAYCPEEYITIGLQIP